MEGLLDGVVVLDLGRVLACPYAATLLADMGATVIKIENPKGGDDTRKMGPFVNGNSVYYANFNRSKIGCTLNLKDPEAKEIFKEMVKKADVVIENYRPGTMEKLGLGYDVLKEVNPGIVYGAVSGFGHTGPYSKRAGYDIVGQAMGKLSQNVGRGRGHEDDVGLLCQRDVGDFELEITVKGVHHALVARQGLERDGGDELGGVFGHDDLHVGPQLAQCAGHVGHFIGGDAAADAQKDAFSLQIHPDASYKQG